MYFYLWKLSWRTSPSTLIFNLPSIITSVIFNIAASQISPSHCMGFLDRFPSIVLACFFFQNESHLIIFRLHFYSKYLCIISLSPLFLQLLQTRYFLEIWVSMLSRDSSGSLKKIPSEIGPNTGLCNIAPSSNVILCFYHDLFAATFRIEPQHSSQSANHYQMFTKNQTHHICSFPFYS